MAVLWCCWRGAEHNKPRNNASIECGAMRVQWHVHERVWVQQYTLHENKPLDISPSVTSGYLTSPSAALLNVSRSNTTALNTALTSVV